MNSPSPKLLPKRDDDFQFHRIDGPVWTDHCEHGKEFYVCSFEVFKHGAKEPDKYDLYVFPQKFFGEEVCIRYSNQPECYCSPGGVGQFLLRSAIHFNDEYSVAAKILSELGRCYWEPREPFKPSGPDRLGLDLDKCEVLDASITVRMPKS